MFIRYNLWVWSLRIKDVFLRIMGMELIVEMMEVGMEYEYIGDES